MTDSHRPPESTVRRRQLLRAFALGSALAASRPALAAPLGSSLLQIGTPDDSDAGGGETCTLSTTVSTSETHRIPSHSYSYLQGTLSSDTRTGTYTETFGPPKTEGWSETYTLTQLWGTATLTAVAVTRDVTVSCNAPYTQIRIFSRTSTSQDPSATLSLVTSVTGGISETRIKSFTSTSTVPCDKEEETPVETPVALHGADSRGRRTRTPIDVDDDLFDPERRRGRAARLNI